MDQINLKGWEGRTASLTGHVSAMQAAMIHATLPGCSGPAPREGDPLPQLWHWCAFPPLAATEDLGRDGHTRLGDFLPPVALDRRMWAGGALTFHAPLRVGEPIRRQSKLLSVEEKDGASGPMIFVTVTHEIHGPRGLAIHERQDIVYLQIPESYRPPRAIPAPQSPSFSRDIAMSAPLLFRYSAVTFNAHRIHYDLPYATGIEHYPGLVVHGPLQATLLIDAATRWRGEPPAAFRFRGVHPLFHTDDLRLMGTPGTGQNDGALDLCTVAPAGHQGMQATARWLD